MIIEKPPSNLTIPLQNEISRKRNYEEVSSQDENPMQLKISRFGIGTRTVKDLPSLNLNIRNWLIKPLQNLGLSKKQVWEGVLRIAEIIFDLEKKPKELSQRFSKNVIGSDDRNYSYPFAFHLRNDLQKKEIKCHIYIPSTIKGSFINAGGCKKIKHSLTLIVPIIGNNSIANTPLDIVKVIYTVIQRTLKILPNEKVIEIYENLQTQNKVVDSIPEEVLRLTRNIDVRSYFSQGIERLEIEQEWYNKDLQHAEIDGKMPSGPIFNSDSIPLIFSVKIDVLIEQAKFLIALHKLGIVHGDIKGANILLKIFPDGRIVGNSTDCDGMRKMGKISGNLMYYPYWDECRSKGYLLPSNDIQGLVMTIMEVLSLYSVNLYKNGLYDDVETNEETQIDLGFDLIVNSINSFRKYYSDRKDIFDKILELPTISSLLKVVENGLQEWQKRSVWTTKQTYEINKAVNQIKIFEILTVLLVKQKLSNKCLWENLERNPDLQEIITTGSEEEVQQAFIRLIQLTPEYLSLDSILESLYGIRKLVVK